MELCKHLSYSRSLSPGKAVFFYKTAESDFVPLRIEVARISGQKCSYSEAYDANFQPKNVARYELAYRNPQTIEACYVPPTVDELFCRFSLRVEANSREPDVCSEPDVRKTLARLANSYLGRGGYLELARRYGMNLLMGSWLWRNQHSQGTRIEVKTSKGSLYTIEDTRQLEWSSAWPLHAQQQLEGLANEMAGALSEPHTYWFADVTAAMKTGFCQEIYPSQRFVERSDRHDEASRQLATTECADGQHAACLHAQKVGAALQLIDDWWGDDAEQPLRVHEYGADPKNLTSYRHPISGMDFYHLLARADQFIDQMESQENRESPLSGEIHYLMAVLVKGGLFQKGKT